MTGVGLSAVVVRASDAGVTVLGRGQGGNFRLFYKTATDFPLEARM
jgi:hypothetical protein